MASGRFSKQADWFSAKLNANYTDSVIGGALTTAPAGLSANQGQATMPGDRVIFSPSDALAWSNNNVGNLYTGTYRYVATANSSSLPAAGRAAFWECNNATGAANSTQDGLYQVTSDEDANHATSLFMGVFVNAIPKLAYWWVQETGKTSVRFCGNNGSVQYGAASLTGTPAIGCGVYLAGLGSGNGNNNVGLFDVITGATTGNYAGANMNGTQVDSILTRFVGVAEGLPSNGNVSLIDIFLNRASFRW